MFAVYVLFSPSHRKTYVGFTSDMLARFKSHNHVSNKGWSRKYMPWVLAHCEYYETKQEAMCRENELKSGKGRDWIKQHLEEWIDVLG